MLLPPLFVKFAGYLVSSWEVDLVMLVLPRAQMGQPDPGSSLRFVAGRSASVESVLVVVIVLRNGLEMDQSFLEQ
jgi:hypothetical protein